MLCRNTGEGESGEESREKMKREGESQNRNERKIMRRGDRGKESSGGKRKEREVNQTTRIAL